MSKNKLYTIGYSGFDFDDFINALKQYKINALIDVRQSPYSQRFEDYRKENLKLKLREHNIHYDCFGQDLGARPEDPALYTNNRVDFSKVVKSEDFLRGCGRIYKGLNTHTICLMCAEKDPIKCHRAILVANQLRLFYPELKIFHIHPDRLEAQPELDKRLMRMFGLDQGVLGSSPQQNLAKAYQKQGEKIAYITSGGRDEEVD